MFIFIVYYCEFRLDTKVEIKTILFSWAFITTNFTSAELKEYRQTSRNTQWCQESGIIKTRPQVARSLTGTVNEKGS